ncbi:MAG: hypothetical protein KDN19_17420 [Verrucomicrobiae bacterium]|nr:hypothetical protein [Verrucomicrobiae bacterium]
MFRKKITPELFAGDLFSSLHEVETDLGKYFSVLTPNESERRRIFLTAFLLPLSAAHLLAEQRGEKALDFVEKTKALYLRNFNQADEIVRCGDLVIWRFDRERLLERLRSESALLISDDGFKDHQIRYALLLRALAEVRIETFAGDMRMALRNTHTSEMKEIFSNFVRNLSASFTRQVLDIDPSRAQTTEDDLARLQASLITAGPIVGGVFFSVSDLMKKV